MFPGDRRRGHRPPPVPGPSHAARGGIDPTAVPPRAPSRTKLTELYNEEHRLAVEFRVDAVADLRNATRFGFWIENSLDQLMTFHLQGGVSDSPERAEDMGLTFVVPAATIEPVVLDDWMPYESFRCVPGGLPTIGRLRITAWIQEDIV